MYEIILSKRVDKLDPKDRERIILSLDKLRIRPEAYLKKLVGEKSYKFRVGDYRLIVDLENDKLLVLDVDIGHRKKYIQKKGLKLCGFRTSPIVALILGQTSFDRHNKD